MGASSLRIHIDDRGVSRQLLDLWIPQLDIDAIWLVDEQPSTAEPPGDALPIAALSATDVAAVAAEQADDSRRALAVFTSCDALETAAMFGLPPGRVVLQRLVRDGDTHRVAVDIELDEEALRVLARLEARGFQFEIQSNPHVTSRKWSPERTRSRADG